MHCLHIFIGLSLATSLQLSSTQLSAKRQNIKSKPRFSQQKIKPPPWAKSTIGTTPVESVTTNTPFPPSISKPQFIPPISSPAEREIEELEARVALKLNGQGKQKKKLREEGATKERKRLVVREDWNWREEGDDGDDTAVLEKGKDEDEDEEEFYDNDDEGFESVEAEAEELAPTPPPSPTASPLQPQGGIFGRVSTSPLPPPPETATENEPDTTTSSSKRRKKPPAPKILQDESNNNVVLSTDTILRQLRLIETPSTSTSTSTSFQSLGITTFSLLEALPSKTPLPVQLISTPAILNGDDVLISSHTGSGKTVAFLAPLIQGLLNNEDRSNQPQILIVAPGRELASQIVEVARELVKGVGDMSVGLLIGGVPISRQIEILRKRKPAIVVGTPGRLAELLASRKLNVNSLKKLVFDEFDNLFLSPAHKEASTAIFEGLQRRHKLDLQTVLCSATAGDMTPGQHLRFLKQGFVTAALEGGGVAVGGSLMSGTNPLAKSTIHGVIKIPSKMLALEILRKIFHTSPTPQQVLVFVNDSRRVRLVVEKLLEKGIVAAELSGSDEHSKVERAEVARLFREGKIGCVVSTELAARGYDVPGLTHVVNLDLPTDASHYVHRSGRCGRGGRPGVVVNIASGHKEWGVVARFGEALKFPVYDVDLRGGELLILDKRETN